MTETIRDEVIAWSLERGQRAVTIEIVEQLELSGDLHGLFHICDEHGNVDEKAVYNNRQQIFRWLRNGSKASKNKIEELVPAIKSALPAERRAKLEGCSLQYLISQANKKYMDAINAVLLGCTKCGQEISDAITALSALSVMAQQIV